MTQPPLQPPIVRYAGYLVAAEGVLGLRLRYEFSRQLAPYLGVEWSGKFGQSADLAHSAGDATSEWRWVGGVRFWF